MRPRTLSSVAGATGGHLLGDDVTVTGVAADTRNVRRGDLFVALAGDRVDGHEFTGHAFRLGAAGVLVGREGRYAGPAVRVNDPGRGLLDLAADERAAMEAEVIGVTGSTGKTTVKDLIAAVLAARYRVAASPRSFNTEVGVPLTLLGADPDTEFVVSEMGSRGLGHIAKLCVVARPGLGVITNVGTAHMEMFGSSEAVAEAKAELVESLPETGTAVLNADDPVVRSFIGRTRARALLFGTSAEAEVRGEALSLDRDGRASFTLRVPGGSERVELTLAGEHMVWNALAAAACGFALGVTAGECAARLKEARVSPWRMEVFGSARGFRVVNDTYNANPESMAAALKAARSMAGEGRCVAVLGEMAELGSISAREHHRVGELVARLGIEELVVIGPSARLIAHGAEREGVESGHIAVTDTVEEAVAVVGDLARPGDVVLVKGSRVAGLEKVAEALR